LARAALALMTATRFAHDLSLKFSKNFAGKNVVFGLKMNAAVVKSPPSNDKTFYYTQK